MNGIRTFERMIGGRWTGIKLHYDKGPYKNTVQQPVKICDAIKKSSTGPLTLTPDTVNCPGGLRSLGWNADSNEHIAELMIQKNGLREEAARSIIKRTPYFQKNLSAITIGDYDDPDLIISYAQPKAAMQLIFKWQQVNGEILDLSVSSMMAVCGSVMAGAHLANTICFSFGCPQSREFGAIGNDRLIVGLPVRQIYQFVN